jgi:hypothetical protein
LSTEPHPIKVATTAPDNIRADEIAINTAKTGKVTAVVTVMSIFCRERCNSQNAKSRDKKLLAKRQKVPNYQREIPSD